MDGRSVQISICETSKACDTYQANCVIYRSASGKGFWEMLLGKASS